VQLREGVLAGRQKNNQELLDGEGVEGIRPDWLEKRKKRQIDWRSSWMEREWRESAQIGWRRGRRGRSIGEGAGAMGLESRHAGLEQPRPVAA
jgi:hypothetical protein